jgi:hypothetical protein
VQGVLEYMHDVLLDHLHRSTDPYKPLYVSVLGESLALFIRRETARGAASHLVLWRNMVRDRLVVALLLGVGRSFSGFSHRPSVSLHNPSSHNSSRNSSPPPLRKPSPSVRSHAQLRAPPPPPRRSHACVSY